MASVSSKTCARCREVLPASDFYANSRSSTGLSSWCRPCGRRIRAESNARIRAADPEAWALRRRGYVASYKKRHPERTAESDRRRLLLRKYGITPEEYAARLREQGGGCAICATAPVGGRALDVDHDHDSGRTRELLCSACNLAIGHLRDRPDLALAAASYLMKWSA